MKPSRKQIWLLFDKHCAYCGKELQDYSGKNMHIDHVEALIRSSFTGIPLFPGNKRSDNIFPSCPQCNNYKSNLSIEEFRLMVKETLRKLERVTLYRNAIRFGFIEVKEWDEKFYFEKQRSHERHL